jgi:hypothetical protein
VLGTERIQAHTTQIVIHRPGQAECLLTCAALRRRDLLQVSIDKICERLVRQLAEAPCIDL